MSTDTTSPFKKRKLRPGAGKIRKGPNWLDCQYCFSSCRVDARTTRVTCGSCTVSKAGRPE